MKNTSEIRCADPHRRRGHERRPREPLPGGQQNGDAAAAFIDKADQTIEKKGLMGTPAGTVAKCIDICQNVVKEGAAISRLLRNPRTCNTVIISRRYEETNPATEDDSMTQSTVEDVE